MRGPPLGPLLPLLLILNTTPANPESTSSSGKAEGEDVSTLSPLRPTYHNEGLSTQQQFQWKVALENSTENSVLPELSFYPPEPTEFDTGQTMTQEATYQKDSSVLNCTKCNVMHKSSELNRQTRSGPDHRNLKPMSQVLESVNNATNSPLEVDNLVASRNDTQISSLGSVDVMVPSMKGMGDPKNLEQRFNISLLFPNMVSARNRSSSVQRLGRTDAPMLNYIFDTYSTLNKHHHRNDRFGGPKIESTGESLSVDTDAEATLDCRVTSLQDKLVSWMRRRPEDDNLELLTIGQQTYTADSRFTVDFRQPDNWRLVLQSAKPADSGVYECQVSTHPPLISRKHLLVNAPVVSIVEAGGRELRDKYYERNSTLKLACRIRHLAAQTPAVFWLHADRILNDDTLRGGVSVRTEAVEGGADSILLVARLNSSDSGRYTCSVGTDLLAVVNVHVLNESLAELHQGVGSRLHCNFICFILPAVLLTTFLLDTIIFDVLYLLYKALHIV